MRVTVYLGLTVDGFVARPDDALDFLPPPPDGESDSSFADFIDSVDVIVMGRRTVEVVRAFGFEAYRGTPLVVLSRGWTTPPPDLPAGSRVVAGTPADVLAQLGDVGHVYVDGAQTARDFLAAGLVTDLVLTQVPVLIGAGIPLFGPLPADIALDHVATRVLPGPMVQTHWRPRRA